MPTILLGIGAFALFAGLVMVGFGIPINEFSFGNTLISAGTTAAVGGLIIIGLGIVAGQVRRVAELLAMQPPGRPALPAEPFENAAPARSNPPQGHAPFQAKPRSDTRSDVRPETRADTHIGEPIPMSPPPRAATDDERSLESYAPTLRNPDQSSAALEDDISLSPHHPAPAAQPAAEKGRDSNWRTPVPPAPPAGAPPVRPIQNANFDAMWPAEARGSKSATAGEPFADARPATPPRELATPPKRSEPEKPRTAAILKSGIVDGMGYTLYVDGSIEAELPQGTLRFASINELRSHLAKNS
ncbi:MAG TPA: hypothetical protein VEC94_09130 [Pseudolabrys sp.]|nr:hypothetical protein [Pseudolabrys sp.]